jgi:DNA invertase Pin-like site-specific DNA recombinase
MRYLSPPCSKAQTGPPETWIIPHIVRNHNQARQSYRRTEAIAERTRDALRHKRSQGQRVGNIPFGSRLGDGQRLEPDPGEQNAEQIRALRSSGATKCGIPAALNHRAYRTRRGTPWRLQSVARVLKQVAAR